MTDTQGKVEATFGKLLGKDGPVGIEVVENVIEPEAFKRKGRGKLEADGVSAELLEKCRDVGLSEAVIDAGGDYRQLEKGKIFWLPLQELWEFEVADLETEDDTDFYDWFKAFVDERQLQKKSDRTKRQVKHWDDESYWNSKYEKTSIGKWWSSWGYSSSGGSGSELTRRLAIALKAITTTVSVVNDTSKRYRVRLAQDTVDAPMSATNYNEQLIVISPQALLDTSLEQDTGIEISTGYGLHEASHVKYSESLLAALTKPTQLRPLSIAHALYNLLEDLRIESLTGAKFPGFAEYFVTKNHYLFDVTKHMIPAEWGPTLQEKLNAAVTMVKHPADAKPYVDASPSLTAEWPWWREWVDAYVANKEPLRQGVIRALEHLAEDEETKKEMDQLTEGEKEFEKQKPPPLTDEQFSELLKGLKALLDEGGATMQACESPGESGDPVSGQPQPITLTDEQAQELERLISEQYQQHEAFYKMKNGPSNVAPIIEMSRPLETIESKRLYKRAGPLAERLREAFFFRKTNPSESERLLKTGFVDEEELWRVGVGDTRVFERMTEPEETFTSVTMLVDTSGSMIGSGLTIAMELANTMMVCLRTQRGVRTRVRAHTTGYINDTPTPGTRRGGETCRMFRIWEPGDPDTRIGLLGAVDHGTNFDGFAIDWCAKELNDTAQTNEQKLLIVLSDGLPNGNVSTLSGEIHYGGDAAMNHIKQVGEYWGRQGVTIVQIAIDADSIRPEDQAKMFKHWIGYESDRNLLTDLTRMLIKAFGGVE